MVLGLNSASSSSSQVGYLFHLYPTVGKTLSRCQSPRSLATHALTFALLCRRRSKQKLENLFFSVRSNDFGWMQTRGGPPCDADPTDGGARLQVRPSPSPYRASTLQQQQQYLRLQFLPPQQRWVLLSNGPLFICSPLRRFEGPEWNSVVRERN